MVAERFNDKNPSRPGEQLDTTHGYKFVLSPDSEEAGILVINPALLHLDEQHLYFEDISDVTEPRNRTVIHMPDDRQFRAQGTEEEVRQAIANGQPIPAKIMSPAFRQALDEIRKRFIETYLGRPLKPEDVLILLSRHVDGTIPSEEEIDDMLDSLIEPDPSPPSDEQPGGTEPT